MGSTKSLRYEVLVYPPKEQLLQQPNMTTSSNSVPQQFMLQTQTRKVSCDRENLQQYWIPDGFRPVLVHRDLLKSSLAAISDVNDSRQMTPTASAGNVSSDPSSLNVLPLRQRTAAITANAIIDGGTAHRSKRRRILSSSKGQVTIHPRISLRTFNATALYYKVKCKELMANGIIPNPPIEPPSKIIGKMWYEEPENVKKHYEIVAHRIKIEQARRKLNHINQNGVNSSPHFHERSMTQQPPGFVISPTTGEHYRGNTYNSNVPQTSSGDFNQYHVPNKSVISCRGSLSNIKGNRGLSSRNFDKIFAERRHDSMNSNDKNEASPSSSPKSATQTINDMNREEDYLTCEFYDEYDDDCDENDVAC